MSQINLLTFSMRSEPPKAGSDWFRIVEAKKSGEATKVYIYDEIGYWGTTAKDFVAQLGEVEGDIDLHMNTPGGSVFDGLAIMAALKDHDGKITGYVDGMAASAGSFILQACDERLITRNAQVMIHDAKAYAGGNAQQMRKAADLLDRVSDNIADIYAVRSGQGTVESWRAIMTAGDEWYSGNEAVTAGLADSVVDNPEEDEDAPEGSSNSWSPEEVEAFLQTSPEKLAASAKHIAITNRVEEAQMTGANTQNQQGQPPAVQQPPATAPAVQVEFPEALASFVVQVNDQSVLDMKAVAAHVEGLETFKREMITTSRMDFVKNLAADGKILANDDSIKASEEFVMSLSPEQFENYKTTMSGAPSSPLFQKHGTSLGNQHAPQTGAQNSTSDRINVLEGVVKSLKDSGLTNEQIEKKDSYKELQTLKSQQTGS